MDLKALLGNAYTEELEKEINAAVSKEFVSKADFNEKNEELKAKAAIVAERDKQLEELKGKAAADGDLKKQIETLQAENTAAIEKYNADLTAERQQRLLETELLKHSPVSLKALKAELDLSKLKYAEDKVEGLTEQIDALKKGDLKALFKAQEQQQPSIKFGMDTSGGGQGGGQNPFKFDFTPKVKTNKEN